MGTTAKKQKSELQVISSHTFTAPSGRVFQLKKIPSSTLALASNPPGRPVPPMKSVPGAFMANEMVPDTQDPDYVAAIQQWTQDQATGLIHLVCTMGVVVPDDIMSDPLYKQAQILGAPYNNSAYTQALWVTLNLGDDDDALGQLIEAVMSITTITEEGRALAEERFRENG